MSHASVRRVAIAALAAALLPAASGATAASGGPGNISLTVEGIPATIEVLSFNFSAKQAGSLASGGGGGAGKVSFSDFTFSSTETSSSPVLFNFVNTGKHSQSARLSILNADTGKPQSEWVLTDVLVTSFAVQNGDPDPKKPNNFLVPAVAFALAFQKACYRVFAADGSVAKESCWNVATNSET
jgi:type VI secretion system secreted protein Hcp